MSRGAFTSLNSVFQNLGIGLAPLLAGQFMGRDERGLITGYGTAGTVAVAIAAIGIGLSFLVKPATKSSPLAPRADSDHLLMRTESKPGGTEHERK